MKIKHTPECPYCRRNVSYIETFAAHTSVEYKCIHCGYVSGVMYSRKIKQMSVITIIIDLLLLILFSLLGSITWWEILILFIPFLIFYALIPFRIGFKKIDRPRIYIDNRNKIKDNIKREKIYQNNSYVNNMNSNDTVILNDFNSKNLKNDLLKEEEFYDISVENKDKNDTQKIW